MAILWGRALARLLAVPMAAFSMSASAAPQDINLVGVKLTNPVHVTSKAVQSVYGAVLVPGTLICGDYEKVQFVADLFEQHALEVMQDQRTGGQSRLIRGAPSSEPNAASHGCALVPPGRAMSYEVVKGVPVVSATSRNGVTITGVTLLAMIHMPPRQRAANSPSTSETPDDQEPNQ